MDKIMLSISPYYAGLILDGKKTVELRKTKPKTELPFEVYLYSTRGGRRYGPICPKPVALGKVVGRFICEDITSTADLQPKELHELLQKACVTREEYHDMATLKPMWGWKVAYVDRYKEPMELEQFSPKCLPNCRYLSECGGMPDEKCLWSLSKAPQSWCYTGGPIS